MHNVGSLTLSELWTAFQAWQGNVSLDESITRMEEFTSTFFATSDGSFGVEELMYSMWEESIQMLSRLMALRRRDTITRSRMEMLYAGDSNGLQGHRAEVSMGRLILSGLVLRRQRIETSFGNWCTSTILELQSLFSRNFEILRLKFAYHPPVYESPAGATYTTGEFDGRDDWVRQAALGSGGSGARVKSLVLYGPSQTGKTTWARSLGNHVYVLGLVSGKICSEAPNVDYAVFDDIRGGIKFFHAFKEWLGCQAYVTVKELYKEPKQLPWGKPSIWCANADPRMDMSQVDHDWMMENCVFIEVTDKIVHFDN